MIGWVKKIVTALLAVLVFFGGAKAQVRVFAAASLIDVMGEVGEEFESQTGIDVSFIHAGSSTLAHQIVAGAPADIFISANANWISFVQEKTDLGEAKVLFSNRLVVVVRAGSEIELDALSELPSVLGDQRLAMGDPNHVPAGIYAQQALQNVQLWGEVANKLAPAANVRDALLLVAAGAAPLGIIYASDALDPRVRVIETIDDRLHQEIAYWGALDADAGSEAQAFFDYLQGSAMREAALKSGFSVFEGE